MKKIIPILIIIAGVVIGAIWLAQSNRQSSELEKVSIRLKWLHQAQFAGFYYADKAGYYKDEGLDVKLNAGGVDFPAVQMVAGGSDHFGVTGADQVLLAREKGIPIVALAVIYRKSPFVLFSLKESGIDTPQKFVGKKVGVKLGGNEELTYRALLKNAGVDSAQLEEIPVKFDITPLITKQIDVWPGYAINEPITAEEQGHPVNLIWPSDYRVNLYADTLFTTEEMIRTKPDVVRKFVKATTRGWEESLKNPEQAVTYTLQYSDKLTREHETKMMNASIPLIKPDNNPVGFMDRAVWVAMQDLLLKQGFMKQAVDIDKVFTTEFLP
jgi:ABC-type nitrate/sulfonate/bicarbonate transport system substrate-binding protein